MAYLCLAGVRQFQPQHALKQQQPGLAGNVAAAASECDTLSHTLLPPALWTKQNSP